MFRNRRGAPCGCPFTDATSYGYACCGIKTLRALPVYEKCNHHALLLQRTGQPQGIAPTLTELNSGGVDTLFVPTRNKWQVGCNPTLQFIETDFPIAWAAHNRCWLRPADYNMVYGLPNCRWRRRWTRKGVMAAHTKSDNPPHKPNQRCRRSACWYRQQRIKPRRPELFFYL
jgi:hypothetical protein